MSFDQYGGPQNHNDQWLGIIPALPAGTQVYFYIRSDGYAASTLYDPTMFGSTYQYKSQ
jgi:hypothetical protein